MITFYGVGGNGQNHVEWRNGEWRVANLEFQKSEWALGGTRHWPGSSGDPPGEMVRRNQFDNSTAYQNVL
jgi:hypothetical protein